MQENKLRSSIANDEPVIGTRLLNPWPGTVEVLAEADVFDYVEFLGEYGPWDLHDLENFCRTTELTGLSSMIKVDGANRTFIAQRAMAAGFQNFLFADIKTVEDARECVDAVRPEPDGENGIRMDRRNNYVGSYSENVVQICDDAVIAIMVEKRECTDNLTDILAVDGIDMVVFGPGDYSLSIDKLGEKGSEEVLVAERTTIETALANDVRPRAEISHPSEAEPYLEKGVQDFNLNIDVGILHEWWSEKGSELDELVT
jgi:2-keto-3-deoxy-L-rhamnonate aldolase RhmA